MTMAVKITTDATTTTVLSTKYLLMNGLVVDHREGKFLQNSVASTLKSTKVAFWKIDVKM